MTSYSVIGIIILFGIVIVNRIINERNLKKLSNSEKLKLINAFSKTRIVIIIPTIVIIILFFLGINFFKEFAFYILIAAITLIIINYILNTIFIYRKLKGLNVPAGYIKATLIGRVIYSILLVPALILLFF